MASANRWFLVKGGFALATLLVFGSPAFAIPEAPVDTQAALTGKVPAPERLTERPNELAVFQTSSVKLAEAMLTVQSLHPGSIIADASFDGSDGKPVFRVKAVEGGTLWENSVDGTTGAVDGQQRSSSVGEMPRPDQDRIKELVKAKATLIEAIRVAEKAAGGSALSAGLVWDQGRQNYMVVVLKGADLKQVLLEPPH